MEHGNHSMHMAQANQLANPNEATHVAIRSGDWSDPATWEGGRIPGADAKVLIPAGTMVTYDVDSDVPLETVRVDGHLKWSTTQNTEMLVETIVTTHGSLLEVGSVNNPIAANVDAVITFRDTPIDTNEDPNQLSHGLVAFGEVNVEGVAKESHLAIEGRVDRGDRTIEVDGNLGNWSVGDTIVIIGTGSGSRDEERTITSINGDTITFDRPLDYSHNPPAGFDFETYVGNLTRNVTFQSENPEGVRGHVMLHNGMGGSDGVSNSIQYAAFDDLGRTDSSIVTGTAGNPTGRYPLHLHEIGTEPDSAINNLIGNAINGSPGWGITHHSSHAAVNNNFVYDTVGSGIISEMGDETGEWIGNLVSSVDGDGVTNPSSQSGHAITGSEGAAFENQSRVIIQQDNVAANSAIGWNYSGRESFIHPSVNDGAHRKMFERDQLPFDPSPFDVALDHEEPPITDFNNNTVIASGSGLRVFHRQYSDDTDTMSVFRNFDVWGGGDAVHLDNYASNYQFMDSTWQGSGTGFRIERKTSSVVFNDVEFHDFGTGYRSYGVNHEVVLIDTTFDGVSNRFDLKDLMKNVDSSSLRNELIKYYRDNHGIDYTNPTPQIVNSSNLNEVSAVTFTPDSFADLTIGPGDKTLNITGTIRDSVGVRNFNEYVIAKTPSGTGSSKDFEGIELRFGSYSQGRQIEFETEEFLELHGTYQKSNGQWVAPVVNWITDRLTGDQHPVIIEINLEGFGTTTLNQYKLDSYPNPGLNNAQWYKDNTSAAAAQRAAQQTHDNTHHTSHETPTSSHQMTQEPESTAGENTQASGDHTAHEPETPEQEVVVSRDSRADSHDLSAGAPKFGPTQVTEEDEAAEDAVIEGTEKRDRISGDENNNIIHGRGDRDVLYGGEGDDTLDGGFGRDHLFGGEGADSFVADAEAIDDIHDFSIADGDVLDLSEVATQFGMSAAEMEAALYLRQIGRGVRVELEADGESHSLVVIRGVQADVLKKAAPWVFDSDVATTAPAVSEDDESGHDTSDAVTDEGSVAEDGALIGDEGNNTLIDGAESTHIEGLGGRDTIDAGAGDDQIIGGAGRDKMTGGEGADAFIFETATLDGYRDDIYDFNAAEGDTLDFSQIAEAYGLSDDEVLATIELSKIKPGLKIQLELNGTSHKVAVLHGLDVNDIDAVQDALTI